MKNKKYVVIKIGSSVITDQENRLATSLLSEMVGQVKQLVEKGIGVCIVMSGAVHCGEQFSTSSLSKQAIGGIGQAYVTQTLYTLFQQHNLLLSQMLLSKWDMDVIERKAQVKEILQDSMNHNVVPLLNENDVVQLNSFSGNDFLAAEIAKLIAAEYLLLLTDVEGVYDKNMEVITFLSGGTSELAALKKHHTKRGVGGISGKITAARIASDAGITTYISSGRTKNILSQVILKNKHIGTKIL